MKTHNDPRHIFRIKVMQSLFARGFSDKQAEETEVKQTVEEIEKNKGKIDELIVHAAPTWPIDKINKIDLCILRQAIFELLIEPKVPVKVVIDEAIEIAKEYGSESAPAFVNGVLGKIIEYKKLAV